MPSNIPPSTLDAARHDDPAWWDECAAFHELAAQWFESDDFPDGKAHHAAAALACRTFAFMLRRGEAIPGWPSESDCTFPAAAADALREDAGA